MKTIRQVLVFSHKDKMSNQALYKAYFHKFVMAPAKFDTPCAIIEKFNGDIEFVSGDCLRFITNLKDI